MPPGTNTSSISSSTDLPKLDDATLRAIQAKAKQIARKSGFIRSDVDDLEQDLGLELWKRLGKFDPTKAERAAFVRMLLAHATGTILRSRKRRTKRAVFPLTRILTETGDSPPEPIDPITSRREDDTALMLDVEAVLATLPRTLRRVALTLRTDSITAAAKRLRLSRDTLYRRLEELREAFTKAGLGKICDRCRTVRKRPG